MLTLKRSAQLVINPLFIKFLTPQFNEKTHSQPEKFQSLLLEVPWSSPGGLNVRFASFSSLFLLYATQEVIEADTIHANRSRTQLNDCIFFCLLMFKMTDYRHYLELIEQISSRLHWKKSSVTPLTSRSAELGI